MHQLIYALALIMPGQNQYDAEAEAALALIRIKAAAAAASVVSEPEPPAVCPLPDDDACRRLASWNTALSVARRYGRHVVCFTNCEPPSDTACLEPTCILASCKDGGKPRVTVCIWYKGKLIDEGDYLADTVKTGSQIKWYIGECIRQRNEVAAQQVMAPQVQQPAMQFSGGGGRACSS